MRIIPLIMGAVLDLLFGDPRCIPHPVIFIGKLITALETLTRRVFPKSAGGEFTAGVVTSIVTITVSTMFPLIILSLCRSYSLYLYWVLSGIMCWQCIAAKSLYAESMRVYKSVKSCDLEKSRYDVSMIVGRDTQNLSFEGVEKAAVETVAENTSDGVIAPLIFFALFGGAGAFFYKAVNTLDSMIGYNNDKYRNFGKFAARLDDAANFIPARISALAMILSSGILGYDMKGAWKIWRRDRFKHKSPNSAQTESAAAGALGIRLAGDASYFGKTVKKPFIGDDKRSVENEDIRRVNKLMWGASAVVWILIVLAYIIVGLSKWKGLI